MPISAEARVEGAVVSYSDAANPRRVGTVEDVRTTEWGTDYGVRWADGELTYADLRQHGWNVEPPAAVELVPVPALTLEVYRSARDYDCTMGGISSRYAQLALVGTVDQRYPADLSSTAAKPLPRSLRLPDYFEHPEGTRFAAAPVVLLVRNMGTSVYFSLVPAVVGEDGRFRMMELSGKAGAVMAGGNLASTTDSRLKEVLGAFVGKHDGEEWTATLPTALSIHDRVEPWRN